MVCGVCVYVLFNGLDLSIDLGKRRHRSSALQTHLSPNPTAFMHLLLPILRPVLFDAFCHSRCPHSSTEWPDLAIHLQTPTRAHTHERAHTHTPRRTCGRHVGKRSGIEGLRLG